MHYELPTALFSLPIYSCLGLGFKFKFGDFYVPYFQIDFSFDIVRLKKLHKICQPTLSCSHGSRFQRITKCFIPFDS